MQNEAGLILLAGLLACGSTMGGPLSPFEQAIGQVCLSSSVAFASCDIALQNPIVSDGTASITGSFGSAAAGSQLTTTLSATATYGVLKAGVSSTLNISGPPKDARALAVAEFQDVMTINYAPFTGQPGLLYFNYTLDGTVASSGIDKAVTTVVIQVGPSLQQTYSAAFSSSTSAVVTVPAFSFIYGQPFGFST